MIFSFQPEKFQANGASQKFINFFLQFHSSIINIFRVLYKLSNCINLDYVNVFRRLLLSSLFDEQGQLKARVFT